MCLALPLKVEKILSSDEALVELNGVKTQISISLVDDVAEGDYVIVHVGYALSKLDPDEAQKTLNLFNQENSNGYVD